MTDPTAAVEALFAGRETLIARDLKLNLKRLLADSALAGPEAPLALLAAATALHSPPLAGLATELLAGQELAPEAAREAAESAALMGMLNTYYRFRHMLTAGQGAAHVAEHYAAAGLRMTALARPVLGKEQLEQLAFVVSVLNGCETCINAHAEELGKLGVVPTKLHDLARLAAVAKGVATLAQA